MIMPHPIGVVKAYLEAGFTVAYVDADEKRRNAVKVFHTVYPPHMLTIKTPVLTGESSLHYNVLVMVNEHNFDPTVRKELCALAGVSGGMGSMIIRISV